MVKYALEIMIKTCIATTSFSRIIHKNKGNIIVVVIVIVGDVIKCKY